MCFCYFYRISAPLVLRGLNQNTSRIKHKKKFEPHFIYVLISHRPGDMLYIPPT